MEIERMMPDDISSFGTKVPIKNKQYWIDYFNNNMNIRKASNLCNHSKLNPIKQVKSINIVGEHTIFYLEETSINGKEIMIELTSKKILIEEL